MMSAGNIRINRNAKAIFFSMGSVLEVRSLMRLSLTGVY
jgi:hypothetical protein